MIVIGMGYGYFCHEMCESVEMNQLIFEKCQSLLMTANANCNCTPSIPQSYLYVGNDSDANLCQALLWVVRGYFGFPLCAYMVFLLNQLRGRLIYHTSQPQGDSD